MTAQLPVPLGVVTLRLLGRLRDDGAIELATARGVESLAERLAEHIEEEGDAASTIAEWLVEQPEVVDLFADDAALGATLKAIRRELAGGPPSALAAAIKPTKKTAKPRVPSAPKTARPVETYARWDEAREAITIAGKSLVETVDGLGLWWARIFEAAGALDPAAWTAIVVDPRDDAHLYAALVREDAAGLTTVSPRFAAHLPKRIDPDGRGAAEPPEAQPYAWTLAESALGHVSAPLRALRERHPAPIHRWPADAGQRLDRRLA